MLEKHINHVNQMLTLLQRAGVAFKFKKCFSFSDTIDYPEDLIQPRRLDIAAHMADAIQKLKRPGKITKLRSFLGLCNSFRLFVSSFARSRASPNRKL